jgi:acetyl-CoA acetyltransferase
MRREEQYQMSQLRDREFQKKYMTLPFDVPNTNFSKIVTQLEGDEGVMTSSREGLAALKPVLEGGTMTAGAQTHPADGNAGMVLTTSDMAVELSLDNKIEIRIIGFGSARVELGYMPVAPIPAAEKALAMANISFDELDAVKTHNPFAINDLVFAKKTGFDVMAMNNYGCSLVWGHPSSATGLRSVIELIEELVSRGGGIGLFTGCAGGDAAMAVLIQVAERK